MNPYRHLVPCIGLTKLACGKTPTVRIGGTDLLERVSYLCEDCHTELLDGLCKFMEDTIAEEKRKRRAA